MERHMPRLDAPLLRCAGCGLEYFSPTCAGDARFYQQLMGSMPYELDRWEFGIVPALLEPGSEVVDLGCGTGEFLRRVAPRLHRAVGVDHNVDAIDKLTAAGIEGYAMDFAAFARQEAGMFDVACSFHTLEHLPRAALLMQPAVSCVRPGGRIFVSVPNRCRYGRKDIEPLDCPPHHVTRWDAVQFKVLAEHFGIQLVAVEYEQPPMSLVRLAYRDRGERVFSRVARPNASRFLARSYAKAAIGPRRHTRGAQAGRFTRRGLYGHSMLAEYRRPSV